RPVWSLSFRLALLPAGQGPELNLLLPSCRSKGSAVRAERDALDPSTICLKSVYLSVHLHVPEPHRPIPTAPGQSLAVRAERDAVDNAVGALAACQFRPRAYVPQASFTPRKPLFQFVVLPTARGQGLAVRAERHGEDLAGVTTELVDFLAGF